MSPRVVLVGLPGAGKSTTGRRLAKILGVPFADSDHLVESATGCSVPEIFAAEGEAGFRRLEAAAIAAALDGFNGVLALGGGALTTQATREAIAASGVAVAYLRANLATLASRIGDGGNRPLLADDPRARLAVLDEQRAPLYAAAATFTLETDNRTPGQVAAQIAARLHERAGQP